MISHKSPQRPMKAQNKSIDKSEQNIHSDLFLTGTHFSKLDNKKRLTLPKQILKSLLALNREKRRLYLEKDSDKIIGYSLFALDKLRKELRDLPFVDNETRNKMAQLGSRLYETSITGDGRIVIPDEILFSSNIKPNSDVRIVGAFEFITISAK